MSIIPRHSYLIPVSLFAPSFLFAQTINNVFDLEGFGFVILNDIAMLLWGVAIVAFFWGIVKFIANSADSKEREEGKKFIVWGLISFVVLVSLWAIVAFLINGLPIQPVCYIDKTGNPVLCP